MVAVVGGNKRVTIGVGLRGEGFGRSVERDLLWDLLLLGLCVLCVVLSLPQLFAEGLVRRLSFLLQRCTLLKTMLLSFLGWKWWAMKVASREELGLLLWFNLMRVEIRELRPEVECRFTTEVEPMYGEGYLLRRLLRKIKGRESSYSGSEDL